MSGLIGYLGHQGIVRVLSVPVAIAVLVYLLYLMAAPPAGNHRDDSVEPS